jgi:CRP-like cAMP-binding protein
MDSILRSPNRLLANLSQGNFEFLRPALRTVELVHAVELVDAGDELIDAYFPHSGIISLVIRLTTGEATEIAMVGRDTVFGASAALGAPKALTTAIVQAPGICSMLPVKRLQEAAEQSMTFRQILAQHEQAIFVQAQQSVACLASHTLIARLSRWLLRARDVAETDELQFTQEFLAQMLGVKRNAISLVATELQGKGLIRFRRGRIHILDVPKLMATACECYATLKDELEHLKRSQLN